MELSKEEKILLNKLEENKDTYVRLNCVQADVLVSIISKLQKENEKQGKVIEKTLDYIEREEIDSIGTPFIYTFIGKKIKSLLKGEDV